MQMTTKDREQFAWTGWFSLIGGLAVMAMLPTLYQGLPAVAGAAVLVLVGLGAGVILARGWFMLSLVSKERNGVWPAWGLFQVLPWIGAMFVVAVILSAAALASWWFGPPAEAAMLHVLPNDIGWSEVLEKTGYVVPFASVAWRAPMIWAKAAHQARTLVQAGSAA